MVMMMIMGMVMIKLEKVVNDCNTGPIYVRCWVNNINYVIIWVKIRFGLTRLLSTAVCGRQKWTNTATNTHNISSQSLAITWACVRWRCSYEGSFTVNHCVPVHRIKQIAKNRWCKDSTSMFGNCTSGFMWTIHQQYKTFFPLNCHFRGISSSDLNILNSVDLT